MTRRIKDGGFPSKHIYDYGKPGRRTEEQKVWDERHHPSYALVQLSMMAQRALASVRILGRAPYVPNEGCPHGMPYTQRCRTCYP